MNGQILLSSAQRILHSRFQTDWDRADAHTVHDAVALAVMEETADNWMKSRLYHASVRRAYYFSAEYLMGRQIYNNLFATGLLDSVRERLEERGIDISLFDEKDDAALGNGGLGRLAACFLDSAATHNIPLDGYGLRYRFGLFSQRIENGFQREYPCKDNLICDPWSIRKADEAVRVHMGDSEYLAVPYDMPIIGYRTDNIGTLRLFSCESEEGFDLDRFNAGEYYLAGRKKMGAEIITSVLYPNDNTYDGKRLRFMQQYLLASAGMQDIISRVKKTGRRLCDFSAHCAIQLNDTHPTLAIPELIRLLMLEGMDFSEAMRTACETFSYTNHTVMAEALEVWDKNLICSVVPEIYDIICRIEKTLSAFTAGISRDMHIVQEEKVHMANLASYVSSHINGVAKLHTEILKYDVLKGWYALYPERFSAKTNGITQRRFLGVCNPLLTEFITEKLGSDDFLTDATLLSGLRRFTDPESIERFAEIKRENKKRLAARILRDTGVSLPTDFVFDVQIKRLHEYKRQLMNAFSIYSIYCEIKSGALTDFQPTCFIFGAKAASGYMRAKGIIKYINELAGKINSDPDVQDFLRVVFVPDYNCSYAELIIPAADISEQISPVGTEASGTGNMKLMMSGAVTLGTYDGANIEIAECAGFENNYIFSRDIDYGKNIYYSPLALYDKDPCIRRAADSLTDGTFSDDGTGLFADIYNSLLYGECPDRYYIFRDFEEYMQTKLRAIGDYRDRGSFYRKCLLNCASSGFFSADRTVREYADEIWHIRS